MFNKSVIQEIKTLKKFILKKSFIQNVLENLSILCFFFSCEFWFFVVLFCFFELSSFSFFSWTTPFLTKILGLSPYILNRPIRFSPPNIQILINYGNANQTFLLAITIGSVAAALVFLAMLFLDDHHSIDDPCCTFIGNLL